MLRLGIVCSVVAAVLVVATTSRWGLWWRLITFTYQANLLAAGYYLWTLVRPRADARAGLHGAVVLYVVMAGLVWNLFLTGHSMGYTVANLLLQSGHELVVGTHQRTSRPAEARRWSAAARAPRTSCEVRPRPVGDTPPSKAARPG